MSLANELNEELIIAMQKENVFFKHKIMIHISITTRLYHMVSTVNGRPGSNGPFVLWNWKLSLEFCEFNPNASYHLSVSSLFFLSNICLLFTFKALWNVLIDNKAKSCCSSAYLVKYTYTSFFTYKDIAQCTFLLLIWNVL